MQHRATLFSNIGSNILGKLGGGSHAYWAMPSVQFTVPNLAVQQHVILALVWQVGGLGHYNIKLKG